MCSSGNAKKYYSESVFLSHQLFLLLFSLSISMCSVSCRATVVESSDTWFMDDGALTKRFCPDISNSLDEQPEILSECCACSEARYLLTIQGLWSKFTHPKDFPSKSTTNNITARFSDVIGISHTKNFSLWQYGGYASSGLKLFAQEGITKSLEAEIKLNQKDVR